MKWKRDKNHYGIRYISENGRYCILKEADLQHVTKKYYNVWDVYGKELIATVPILWVAKWKAEEHAKRTQ